MIKRMLVVVDDSAAALRAAQLAIDLAAAVGADLMLVAVVEDHVLDAKLRAAAIPEAAVRRARGAVAMLSRVAERAAGLGLRTETEVLSGRGTEQVLAVAARYAAELIVVAREPRGPVNPLHLLEFTDIPVLLVPPGAAQVYGRSLGIGPTW
ncbi:universal stress protein [Kribbella sp. NPDC050124]|uniref:universal stress protein n=1 Tax=Kribbella sp. NPDC050124 TaxID=3364114 RepID=UPI0037930567